VAEVTDAAAGVVNRGAESITGARPATFGAITAVTTARQGGNGIGASAATTSFASCEDRL
jgi:hypothetical protein